MGELAFVTGDDDNGLRERLDKEIDAFNAATTGYTDGQLLCITVRENSGDLAAGLFGWTWGGCGYIDLLWVRSDQRGSGLGTRLLVTAEEEIGRRGCDQVALSTHSFQAPGFYTRFGYQECDRTPAYPHGHDHIHLVKRLTKPAIPVGADTAQPAQPTELETSRSSNPDHARGKPPARQLPGSTTPRTVLCRSAAAARSSTDTQ